LPPAALEGGADDGPVLPPVVGALVGPELEPVAGPEPLVLSPPPQAARIGALAPTIAAIAAQRSTDRRSRNRPSDAASGCEVGGAIVSSLMNLDLQELAG
jgi:hypothetical protein